ncbi:MAG: Crp/Fnr family transcriptional regulator [Cellulosilyticaceae bacterium]
MENLFEQLCMLGTAVNFKKGLCLVPSIGQDNAIYCLKEGLCALVRYTRNGDEIIYHYFKPGDLLGGVYFHLLHHNLNSQEQFSELSQIYAKTDCQLYRVEYHKLNTLIAANPEVTHLLTYAMAKRFVSVVDHFHASLEDSTSIRLYKMLIQLAQFKDNHYIIDKYFTYVEISKYLGVHSVTISRLMLDLKKQGIITKAGHCTVISDMPRLQALCYALDFSPSL